MSIKFDIGVFFFLNLSRKFKFDEYLTITGMLQEDVCTFIIISH
jgi:hypothetical protein